MCLKTEGGYDFRQVGEGGADNDLALLKAEERFAALPANSTSDLLVNNHGMS